MPSAALVISGPTASGKSSLAFNLAEHLDIEIISADSAQVYRGMDIGTAKPPRSVRNEVPHHLIDVRNPEDPYSAADFRQDAIRCVDDISSRGKLPVIVGGTMLYLKALKEGIAELPEADPELRSAILAEATEYGWEHLHQELVSVDPSAAERIKPFDTQRLQRAIEVYRLTGTSLSELQKISGSPCPFPLLEIAIVPPDRAQLHAAIRKRLKAMLDDGFIDEVRKLRENPLLHPDLPAIKAVGYRQVWSYLEGEYDEETMFQKALAATRQLAKRQYTWLRSWSDLVVLEMPDTAQALKIIQTGTIFR